MCNSRSYFLVTLIYSYSISTDVKYPDTSSLTSSLLLLFLHVFIPSLSLSFSFLWKTRSSDPLSAVRPQNASPPLLLSASPPRPEYLFLSPSLASLPLLRPFPRSLLCVGELPRPVCVSLGGNQGGRWKDARVTPSEIKEEKRKRERERERENKTSNSIGPSAGSAEEKEEMETEGRIALSFLFSGLFLFSVFLIIQRSKHSRDGECVCVCVCVSVWVCVLTLCFYTSLSASPPFPDRNFAFISISDNGRQLPHVIVYFVLDCLRCCWLFMLWCHVSKCS